MFTRSGTGDRHADLAVANQDSNTLNVYLGDGTGRFSDGAGNTGAPTGTYTSGDGPFWVAGGDLNHDGRQDAVTANFRDNTVSVLLNSTTPPDFSLSLTPTSRIVARGQSARFTVGIARTSLADPVHFTVSGLPPGVGATFSPNDTTGNASTLTMSTTTSAKTGAFTFTVTGTGGGVTHTRTGQLIVKPK
jgi:VCBS repeat protein